MILLLVEQHYIYICVWLLYMYIYMYVFYIHVPSVLLTVEIPVSVGSFPLPFVACGVADPLLPRPKRKSPMGRPSLLRSLDALQVIWHQPVSMDWEGKLTGNPSNFMVKRCQKHSKAWFPVSIFPYKPIHWQYLAELWDVIAGYCWIMGPNGRTS